MSRIKREVQAMKRDQRDNRGEAERAVDGAVARIGRRILTAPDLLSFVQNLRDLSNHGDDAEVLAEVRGDFCKRLLRKAGGAA